MELSDKVLGIERECLNGRITPAKAADQIDVAIGGITRVEYKDGLKFKVDNHSCRIGMTSSGIKKGYVSRLRALAVAIYYKAMTNGSQFPGEVHIGPGASTKHYRGGIEKIYRELCFS